MSPFVFSKKNVIEIGVFWSIAILWVVKHILGYNMARYGVETPVSRLLSLGVLLFSFIVFLDIALSKKNKRTTSMFILFCFFLLYVCSLIFFESNLVDNAGRSSVVFNFVTVVYYVVYFALGFRFSIKKSLARLVLFFWFLLFLNALMNIDWSFFRISFEGMDSEKVGIYLFLGDSFAFWSLLAISCFISRGYLISFMFLASVVILFFLNSRTSLYAFLATLPVLILMSKDTRKKFLKVVTVVGVLSLFFIDWGFLVQNNARMFALTQISEDGSVRERKWQFEDGLKDLRSNWFWGDYCGQMRVAGSFGSYMHSYISLWRQFGLFPFVTFSFFAAYCVFKGLQLVFVVHGVDKEMCFFVLGGVFVFIEILMARSYVFPYVWFFVGMALAEAQTNSKAARSNNSLRSGATPRKIKVKREGILDA